MHVLHRHRALADRRAATRLTEPGRASPTKKHPGWLDSRKNGGRSSVHASPRSGPVITNPWGSRAMPYGHVSVDGVPPIRMNSASAGSSSCSPSDSITIRSSLPSPLARTIRVSVRMVIAELRAAAVDEVLRHLLLDRLAAHEQRHRPRVRRQVQRRLAGRVGSADDEDVVAAVVVHVARRGAVVDADAEEVVHALRIQPAVVEAGGADRRADANDRAVDEREHDLAVLALAAAGDVRADHDLGAEAHRLLVRGLGESLTARDRSGSPGSSRSARSCPPGRPARGARRRSSLRPSDAA